MEKCICGSEIKKSGLCDECLYLLRAKRSKNIKIIEKFRYDYNRLHNTYKSYGQFVLLLDLIDRRKKNFDNRRKKGVSAPVRRNRR